MANPETSDFSSIIRINKQANSDQSDEDTQGSDCVQSLHASDTGESGEIIQMYCEDCHNEGINNIARAFCIDCVEYYCKDCIKFHKKYLPSHKLLENGAMPRDVCVEKCDVHNDQIIKFYCHRCDKFACKICKDGNHKNCIAVDHVPDLVKDIEKGQELKDVEQDLKGMEGTLTEIYLNININKRTSQKIRDDTEFALESHANNIRQIINENEDKLKDKVNKKKQNDSKRLNEVSLLYENLKSETEAIKKKILSLKGAAERCKLFMTLKKARRAFKDFEGKVKAIQKQNVLQEYKFEPGTKLKTLDEKDFGKIVDGGTADEGECGQESKKTPTQDINIKAENELLDCAVWNIFIFQEHFLTVCDHRNCSIKVIDLRTNKIISVLPIDNPICISKFNDNKLVVSCFNVKELRFMSLSTTGTLSILNEKVQTEMPCWDIACYDDQLIVTMFQVRSQLPGKVQVLNTKGVVLKSIQCIFEGKNFMVSKLALSPDGMSLFMVDFMKDVVIKITTDGTLNAKYENEKLTQIKGLIAGKDGSVYVCDSGSYQIHKLSQDCSQSEVKFDKSHDLWRPISITCSNNGDKLYVGQACQNNIKVFNI